MSTDMQAPLRDAVRSFNKHVLNPAMLHLAGRKHSYASVIRHRGRAVTVKTAQQISSQDSTDEH